MAKKLLITGYSGFVGKNLLAAFQSQFEMSGLSRNAANKPAELKEVYTWDSLNVQQLNQADCVIHLAGKAHDLKNTSDASEYFKVNTELTKKLFDLFLESTATDFIYMSSVKAVADRVEGMLMEEASPDPQTPYGQSKQQAEAYLLDKKLPEGKRLFILRPCMIHGPGNKGNLNLLYKFVQKGIPYPLAGFDNLRSFLSVSNLIFVIERIIDNNNIPGGVYNVADDVPLSTSDVIKIIADTSGVKPKLWKLNAGFIRSAAAIGDKLRLPLNSERLKKLTESYIVSNDKIKKALEIKLLPVSVIEGLETTVKSFGNN